MRTWMWVGLWIGLAAGISEADQPRVSVVLSRAIGPYVTAADGIREALRSAVVTVIGQHDLRGDPKKVKDIAEELARRKPDLIITVGTEATQAMRQRFPGTPIVFSMVVHPETLMATGRSLVGVSIEVAAHEQLRLLRTLLPKATRVGLLCNPAVYSPSTIEQWRKAALQLQLELVVEYVNSLADVPPRLRILLPAIDAFWLISDETVLAPETVRYLLLETLRERVPVLAPSWRFIEEGALMAVGCDYQDVGRQTGELALQLLRGASLGEGRILDARQRRVYLNVKISKILGIEIPEPLINEADRVLR